MAVQFNGLNCRSGGCAQRLSRCVRSGQFSLSLRILKLPVPGQHSLAAYHSAFHMALSCSSWLPTVSVSFGTSPCALHQCVRALGPLTQGALLAFRLADRSSCPRRRGSGNSGLCGEAAAAAGGRDWHGGGARGAGHSFHPASGKRCRLDQRGRPAGLRGMLPGELPLVSV